MAKQKKESGETGKKKASACLRCKRRKVASQHTGEMRDMARMTRASRLLSRAVLQPFSFKEKEARPTYHGGSRDAFVEARRVIAVKNGDKLLRAPAEEKKDDRIIAHHFACNVCRVQASGGDYATITRGRTHETLHRQFA